MKKRRPLAKLIGDLAVRPGRTTPRSSRASSAHVAARRISPRKPPARVEPSERIVTVPSRALQGSPILAALAKAARRDSPRRARDKGTSRRSARPPAAHASRPARRTRRAS
jgi:hypothetical protein